MRKTPLLVALTALAGSACGVAGTPASDGPTIRASALAGTPTTIAASPPAVPFDPREGGFEVGLAEWAVTLEAGAIRPGPVTFIIHNGGTRAHGFEIEAEGADSSGHGSGGGLKAEGRLLQPSQTERITLDLPGGVYKLECLVDGHDDLGMEILMEVREDAPLVTPTAAAPDRVAIEGVAFRPADLPVPAGAEVTWTNDDPTAHTVTADGGGFDSGVLDAGQSFSWTFETTGTVTYFCAIHPVMKGSITVS
ncbi:MAG: cupredoxin family copper-binding protein [Actinomycetota bacterium]